ncbi:MAG TPA: Asp/Glu racemase [Ornithinimicrobium sp.]|uniref:maleate cis-trans isomerase family protein n=1 Tax=Ornithinimicrobium sp. TaxID=1977084 RepID=UPI002B481E65|nr:Asp/Glu racemase [Ornithinimicrobium sp.]HKJ12404.1 Asp/Glu racemase [Ornithinimicrobium sp.]
MSEVRHTAPGGRRSRSGSVGVGVVCPYDFGLDRELWRWVPDEVSLLLNRTPHHPLPVTVEQAETVSNTTTVTACARALVETAPRVVAFACTSGSFVHGVAGEREVCRAIEAAGVPRGVSTSGALLEALRALGVRRLAVATPYSQEVTAMLATFLDQAGVAVSSWASAGLTERIWAMSPDEVAALVRRAVPPTAGADAVFVSCTNVPTLDLIEPLEHELGIPVLSANQVTLWAALAEVGLRLATPGQRLAGAAACGPVAGVPEPGAARQTASPVGVPA